MSVHRVGIVAMSISLTVSAYATNPFLDTKDDKPVSANFRGTEWSDDFPDGIPHEIPLTARVNPPDPSRTRTREAGLAASGCVQTTEIIFSIRIFLSIR